LAAPAASQCHLDIIRWLLVQPRKRMDYQGSALIGVSGAKPLTLPCLTLPYLALEDVMKAF
jgi:hypothetical protein